MPTLYYHPTSPYSRKASAAIRKHPGSAELAIVDVTAGEHRSEAFLARSPFGKLPVLALDDGTTLFESTTILDLVEDTAADRGEPRRLVPEDRAAARLARHWDRVGDLYLINAQSRLLFAPGTPDAATAARHAATALALLDQHLADGRPFVCGDVFTLGDLAPVIGADYVDRLAVPEARPTDRVMAWLERCFDDEDLRADREAGRPLMDVFLARRRELMAGAA